MSRLPYIDRRDAGRALAAALEKYRGRDDLLVLALPRGGVPVAYEVAEALEAPLDVLIVRKLGVPGHEELAMGAIASGGGHVLNDDLVRRLNISRERIDEVTQREQAELARREREYRADRPDLNVEGRTVILIDDGLATGSTMLAAVSALRAEHPKQIIVAVPVAPREVCDEFEQHVETIVCPATPFSFGGVGRWYQDFSQTTDAEVRSLLSRAWEREEEATASR